MSVPLYDDPPGMPRPSGPYSLLAAAGDHVFVAGQGGADADGVLADGIEAQTVKTFRNIEIALASRGLTLRHIARLTTYLVDLADLPAYRAARTEVYARHYPDGKFPPSTLLVVQSLARPEMRVEIDATAVRVA